ncbi:Pentatricopeptide repeat-containing protein, partial [Drosera capensis]
VSASECAVFTATLPPPSSSIFINQSPHFNMYLKQILSKQPLNHLTSLTFTIRSISTTFQSHIDPSPSPPPPSQTLNDPIDPNPPKSFHSLRNIKFSLAGADPVAQLDPQPESDDPINEFLSRFVHIMRGKLNEAYSNAEKATIDGMLVVIVDKVVDEMEEGSLEHMLEEGAEGKVPPPEGFSVDLWRTVWEVSVAVCEDMDREDKKEKMRRFLQCEEVKEMALREEEREEMAGEFEVEEGEVISDVGREEVTVTEELSHTFELPRRHGKIKYKIHGLDLSDPKWAELADKLHEAEVVTWPEEAKSMMGKTKLVMEKVLLLKETDDISLSLAEWIEVVQPSRVDWTNLLEKCKERSIGLYLKVAEHVLDEPSFQTSISDFTKLIDCHAKESRMEDAQRILDNMSKYGIKPDTTTLLVLVRMYCKAGKIDLMKETFKSLRSQGFKPDIHLYSSMIMAYADEGNPKAGVLLLTEMDYGGMRPKEESYMALLRSFARKGDANGASNIANAMQIAGFEPTVECFPLLIEACGRKIPETRSKIQDGRVLLDQARTHFDYMLRIGVKPDDRCAASMLALYETENMLDKALDLLLQLEKDGFEPGVKTYTVLVDWFGKLQLIDEAEQLLGKISMLGEAPPLSLQVSLCDMYSRAGIEKKALQALGVLESKKDQLGKENFERIVEALTAGEFVQHAKMITKHMKSQGFKMSDQPTIAFAASLNNATKRPGFKGESPVNLVGMSALYDLYRRKASDFVLLSANLASLVEICPIANARFAIVHMRIREAIQQLKFQVWH